MLTQDYLKELFDYKNGELFWKIDFSNKIKKGKKAGYLGSDGRFYNLQINKKVYRLHRIIFLWHHGYLPERIDHKDRNSLNNNIENLRACNQSLNMANSSIKSTNTSGYKGVSFRTDTKDEIIISSNATYTTYGNATKTKREGIETSLTSELDHNIGLYGAYTYLDAIFDETYTSGIKAGTNGLVNPGNKIPGTYKHQLYGEISWKYPELGFKTALEGRVNSKVYINDVNTDFAPGYAIANIRAGFEQNISNWKVMEYTRIENIFDKSYIGSVRINDNNNRNFEPSPGRNYLVGVSATYHF